MLDESDVLLPGEQVAYIPSHAEGNLACPDVEYGFVTSDDGDSAFCRYWFKHDRTKLRTLSCSERTSKRDLIRWYTHPQEEVNYILRLIAGGQDVREQRTD